MMRVLTGVHSGAEALLSDDEAVLGRAEDCDFVFDDPAFCDRHIVLRADAGGLVLRVLDTATPVQMDGRDVEGEVGLEPYQVVSIGGVSLAVGPADEAWPAIELPTGPTGAAPEHPEPVAQGSDAEQPAADAPDQDPAVESSQLTRPRRRLPAMLAALGAGVVALVAAVGWLLVPREVERVQADLEEVATRIHAVATRHHAVVEVHEDPNLPGTMRVSGFIETEAGQARMLADLAQAGVRATVHVVSTERLCDYVRSAVGQSVGLDARNDIRVEPVSGAPGKILVSGYLRDAAGLKELQSILERDVAEASAISYHVQTRAERLSDLRERLGQLGLVPQLRIQQFEDRIGLFGPVDSAEQLSDIKHLADTFNAAFDSRPALRLNGTESFLGESTIELDVRAVVLGDDPHVVLHDGERYGRGAKVEGGYVIAVIAERHMILELPDSTVAGEASEATDVAYFIFDS